MVLTILVVLFHITKYYSCSILSHDLSCSSRLFCRDTYVLGGPATGTPKFGLIGLSQNKPFEGTKGPVGCHEGLQISRRVVTVAVILILTILSLPAKGLVFSNFHSIFNNR